MKKIINIAILLLMFAACENKPAEIEQEEFAIGSCSPPIYSENIFDWDKYNEVGEVFASNNFECSDVRVNQNNGKSIKVYGWLIIKNQEIIITHDSLYALGQIEIESYKNFPIYCTSEILNAITFCDFRQKCYLKGELKLIKIQDGLGAFCCQMGPSIILKSIDDIYFE